MNIVPVSTPFLDVVTQLLSRGYRVRFRAEGVSMRPTIRGGETITVELLSEVKMGDIALYLAERGLTAHRVVAIRNGSGNAPVFLTRGEGVGSTKEVVQEQQVLGKVVAVERNGRSIDLGGRWAKIRCHAGRLARLVRHRGARLCGVHSAPALLLFSALVAVFPNSARAVVGVVSTASSSASSGNNCPTGGGGVLTINTSSASTGNPLTVLIGVSATNGSISNIVWNNGSGNTTITTPVVSLPGSAANPGASIYQVANVTAGSSTSTIHVNLSGAAGVACGAAVFSGVASVGVFGSASGTSTTPSVTNTDPGRGALVFDTLGAAGGPGSGSGNVTAGGSQVVQWNLATGANNLQGAASVAPGGESSPPGSLTMFWTIPTSSLYALVAVVLNPSDTTEVQPTSFTVTQAGGRNLITLNTGREVSSLGFNLYREQNGQRVKLNSSLLAGTALLAGSSTSMTAGYVHTWWDAPQAGSSGAQYWVEEVDLHGQHTMYGPATPASAGSQPGGSARSTAATAKVTDATGQVMMLSQVGQGAPGTGVSSAPHALEAHAAPSDPSQNSQSQNNQTQKQYALAAGQAVKLDVQSEGWYEVALPALVAAGFDPNANANTLQLYAEGVEQPILVQGTAGNKLGPQGNIQFYGTGLDTTWSGTRVYWLTWGKGSGQRVQTGGTPPSGATAGAPSFPFTVEWKPRTVYFAALLNGDADNFFGPTLTSGSPVSQAITITNLAANPAQMAQLQVTLQGASSGSHSVAVALNGTQIGTVSFSNQAEGVSTLSVNSSALQNGQNQLTLTVEGGDQDVSLVDNVELSYPHSYTADSGSLRFTASSGQAETIAGFSSPQILVADITNPAAVSLVPGTVTQQAGSYAVTVVPQGGGTRTLLALTSAAQPASITANHPSSWHTSQAGFDMVMISNANFVQSLNPLVTQHQGEGRKVAVIDVDDLYDEFNFGEKSPYALKNFLSTAKAHWQLPPHFVLLVGDATFDPRNYLGVGDFDFVPTYLVDTALLETASDDWFADFSGQGLPQMAIGRLPVRTAQDAAALVSKIVNYDQSGAASWKKQVLLVTDQNDSTDNFEGDTAAVQALLPSDLSVTQISQSSSANGQLLSSLNQGQAMVNFIGHGSEQVWTSGLFSSTDAAGLTNGSMVPFVVSMTCLNGYFQDVYSTALAKALMEAPGGGALAVWASSGLTDSGTQATMNQALIKALFGTQPMSLGEAAATAKTAVTDPDVRRTWILFGDPATKLQQ